MRRRDFVRKLPAATSGLMLAASVGSLEACGGIAYLTPGTAPGRLIVDGETLGGRREFFVQAVGMNRPIYLRASASGGWVAVLASCTHNGCQPAPVADRLVCPCHGSEFSMDGQVLQGPADRPLTRYEVTEEGDGLVVWLDREVAR